MSRAIVACTCGTPVPEPAHTPEQAVARLRRALAHRVGLSQCRAGFVYFIQAASGPIKIGRAADARVRLAEIQTGSHEELVLLATVPGGRVVERQLHQRFAEHRIRGEWFAPAADILAEIERARNIGSIPGGFTGEAPERVSEVAA